MIPLTQETLCWAKKTLRKAEKTNFLTFLVKILAPKAKILRSPIEISRTKPENFAVMS